MSFQVHKGAEAYSHGGSANSSLARLESSARAANGAIVATIRKRTVGRGSLKESGFMMFPLHGRLAIGRVALRISGL
jgi:hypothetical protein